MPNLLENLNQEQLQAVTHTDGPLLIVAGAGTGKTTVVTRRIAHLIQQKLAKPDEILALTFTEKAASEMEERVDLLMPLGYVDVWISTFHSFCERILKNHALEIGISNDFELLDDTRQWVLVHKHLDKFKLDYYRPLGNPNKFIDALLRHFSRCKDEVISPEDYLAYAETLKLSGGSVELLPAEEQLMEIKRVEELANAFHVYQKLLLDNNYLDFGDLINYTLRLFEQRPNILNFYRQKFKYQLVDEFQDTNFAQYQLVRLLSEPAGERTKRNLTVVGDDDQSIYKFRGASVSNIIKFKEDFPESTQITLTENYRSIQPILDLAYNFIQHNNPDRLEVKLKIDKRLKNASTKPGEIQVLEGKDLSEELDLIIKKILALHAVNEDSWNSYAILIRSNAASNEIIPRLEASGIPFTFLANTGLYKKDLIATLIAYLKILHNVHESDALYKILGFPKFSIPAGDIASITQYATKHTLSIFEALESEEAISKVSEESRAKITLLLELIKKHSEAAKAQTSVELFVDVVKDLGIADILEAETLENAQNREFLEQFYKKIEAFEQNKENTDVSIRAFLNQLELELEAGDEGQINFDPNLGPESLKVMTIHSAKGLEFEHVFIANLVDQRFPTRAKRDAIEIPDALIKDILPEGDFHLEEERRLFYVAVTRAKRNLYLSWAKDYGGARMKKPSLFLEETSLVPSEKISKATGKVVFSKPSDKPRKQVFQILPTTFSYSAVNSFKRCPLEYKYAHYFKLPLRGSPQQSFGITMHCTFQKYLEEYQRTLSTKQLDLFGGEKSPSLPPFERLQEIYAQEWVDEWYPTKKDKEDYRTEKGPKMLKNFFDYTSEHLPKPKFIEKRFSLTFGEFTFVGKIDRADESKEGLAIIDYKTGKPQKKEKDEDIDQLRIYQLAAERQYEEKVESLCYWYLEENQFVTVPKGNGDDLLSLEESLLATMHEIREAVKFDTFAALHKKAKQHVCKFENW
jgi:DNA helicase-2/ATP-dependent DNA helicase PcrA